MTLYLADTSSWHRSPHPEVASAWRTHLANDDLAICDQVRLEILFSAQSGEDYDRLNLELGGLRSLPCGNEQYERALEVQRALAHRAGLHHRSVKIADLLIAASAEYGDATVWHYDRDFERIAEITGQPTRWVAPPGSID